MQETNRKTILQQALHQPHHALNQEGSRQTWQEFGQKLSKLLEIYMYTYINAIKDKSHAKIILPLRN